MQNSPKSYPGYTSTPAGYSFLLDYVENRKEVCFIHFISAVEVILDLQRKLFYTGHISKLSICRVLYNKAHCVCSVILKSKTEAIPTNTPLTNFVSYVTVSINLLSGCQYKLLFWWFLVPILLKGKATINTRETDLSDFLCSDRSTMRSNTTTRRSGLFRIPPAVIYSKNK